MDKCNECKSNKTEATQDPCYSCDGETNFEPEKECKDMDIKINRKSPMTEQERQNKILEELKIMQRKVVDDYKNGFIITDVPINFKNKIMEICKNDPQEIESIEVDLSPSSVDILSNCERRITLTYDQYKQIKAAVEGI